MPRAASFDLSCNELVPARLDAGEVANRDALHFRNGLADLRQDALLLILRQSGPRLRAQDAGQTRDDQIRPTVALALQHDFRNRDAEMAAKLRQRATLGHE